MKRSAGNLKTEIKGTSAKDISFSFEFVFVKFELKSPSFLSSSQDSRKNNTLGADSRRVSVDILWPSRD